MKRLVVFLVCAMVFQSCVEEVGNPFGSPPIWENHYFIISGDTNICLNYYETPYLIYDSIGDVDSIQWHPKENLNYSTYSDSLRLLGVYPYGDTASISLVIFDNADTSEIIITVYDCFQTMYIPNGFTPDGDGINDKWYPVFSNIQELEWTIHSDEGHLIFDNQGEIDAKWDGTWNGNPAPEGLYRFDLRWFSFTDTLYKDRSGWLQLYRSEE